VCFFLKIHQISDLAIFCIENLQLGSLQELLISPTQIGTFFPFLRQIISVLPIFDRRLIRPLCPQVFFDMSAFFLLVLKKRFLYKINTYLDKSKYI
jgi:hypothetical protein